ncbi:hypothetical protein ACELLULO517_15940 [Acidisoma cellulosilytica]|uniref:Uncharacterized protein n=1 Tax=Acidisoma cellulosilyticum TaxID=2802395 RepID=A0A963Z2U2_9PROT|nr:hypothetical protein [Acidisoma cellulosilyticum]MCB8881740.1 hypothetical protein [Acidisoma cellulosilyticum]
MAQANISTGTKLLPSARTAVMSDKPRLSLRSAISSQAYGAVKRAAQVADAYSKFHDRVTFDDRRVNANVLVTILAGYKQDLWPLVMPRLKAAIRAMNGADICFVSPGKRDQALADLCKAENWSYLATSTNDVSLAQNICFKQFDQAQWIVKLDEDMFLLPDTIVNLVREYKRIKDSGKVDPGFVAPMIPLNGFCYRPLLSRLGLLAEFEARFGKARLATSGLPIHTDPIVARWIWEKTSPLDELAQQLGQAESDDLLSPIQFSIGIIVFERSFWETFGYFTVHRRKLLAGMNTLGGDEAHICAAAMLHSRPIVVTTHAVAGHFSFGGQYAGMIDLMRSKPDLFA